MRWVDGAQRVRGVYEVQRVKRGRKAPVPGPRPELPEVVSMQVLWAMDAAGESPIILKGVPKPPDRAATAHLELRA